jgi:hypothetical protein
MMEAASITISGIALAFSVISFVLSFRHHKKIEETQKRLDYAMFDVDRDSSFEGRLGDWPTAFKLHGVDMKIAEQDGLTPEQIAYLVLSINGLESYCNASNVDISEQLKISDYRQRMLAQPGTRLAWRYARLCIPKKIGEKIDEFLHEKYGDNYPEL